MSRTVAGARVKRAAVCRQQQKLKSIYGTGEKRRDFIYIDDVNDLHLTVLEKDEANGRIFNVGSGTNHSVNEIYALVEGIMQTGLKPGSIPPFGSLFGLPTHCDPALAANDAINFNAGDHSISVHVAYDDYVRAEGPSLKPLT